MIIHRAISRVAIIRTALLGATVLAGAVPAFGQTASQPQQSATPVPADPYGAPATVPPAPTAPAPQGAAGASTLEGASPIANPSGTNDAASEIVVTGYRKSLAESTNAKRVATSFTDSIFAEDIGKFPDTNIAESFNRIPGITISRDIDGEGTNVAIRGLGSNFTEVTMNGAPISVASSGVTDAGGTDRSVDLSFFPTDLFTKLTVNKSYTADLLEGGAAGNVDIRSARPFDHPGKHFTYNFQGTDQSGASGWGERGSAIASATFGTFGILAGVSGQHEISRVRGYETIGYTNAALTAAQCGAATGCNSTGGGNFTIPSTVPSNAGNGLTPGQTIDEAFLLAHNPGLTIQQIDNAILPRLGRPSDEFGSHDRINGIVSAEWRPSDALHFYVDGMYGWKKNDLQRIDMDWVGRNGAIIPLNMTVDKSDCSQGCTVTGGTFANSQFFLEYRPYTERTTYYGVNPGMEWQIAPKLKFSLQGDYNRSTFHRASPSVVVNTPVNSGTTVTYKNDGGIPTIDSNVDLNDPSNFVWAGGGRVNIQDERRLTQNKGARGDLTWGDDHFNVKVGANYDDISRRISAYDNSQAWQNAVCGDNPSAFLPTPNSQPACEGLDVAGAAPPGYPTYPAYGTGFTSGATGPVTYGGSLIPASQLANFLKPGPDGFVTVDWDKFRKATNYDQFHADEPSAGSANTGASGGYIREKSPAAYIEANGIFNVADSDLRYNIGVRYVHTDQTIRGQVSLPDPRNPTDPAAIAAQQGALYPNVVTNLTTHSKYTKWLPAMNLAYDVGPHAVARFALSETMTRPDPNAQLPGVNFSSPSADVATLGNPALKPYTSKNIDLGIEYYTGHEGLISVAAFRKELQGFTQVGTTTVPFAALAMYGITYGSLTPTQQAAITARGGPDAASVQVQQQVNASGKLTVDGLEFQWVQPLDFLTERFGVKGFGFNANATIVDQNGSGAAPAVALGVAKYTYNISAYYENHGISLRVSTTFQKGSQQSLGGQNGITQAALFSDDYQQWDFSSIFDLEKMFGIRHAPQVTFDVVNFGNAKLRQYFQFSNATFTEYKPGRQFLVGVRGTF
jgi:TonB-dependent receptor